MTKKEARDFIEKCEWVYARSYSETFPHEYTTRDRVKDDEAFNDFILFLRESSIAKSFFRKVYLYMELDGLEYWEMGRPKETVIVINRAKINDEQKYRNYQVSDVDRNRLVKAMADREERFVMLKEKKDKNTDEALEWEILNDYDGNKLDELSKIKFYFNESRKKAGKK